MFEDIAAIITPLGKGAVAGLRLAGPNSIAIARTQFLDFPKEIIPNRATFGHFSHGDHGIAIAYLGPHSYTGEDAVEFFTHGSPLSIESLLHRCLDSGARLAVPGEFTLRAFLNGKIDLTQAEAIPQIVDSETDSVLQAATSQLAGSLKKALTEVSHPLESTLATIEAWVDFSEELGDLDPSGLAAHLERAEAKVAELVAIAEMAPKQRAGRKIVIVGPPNSGKSSLYNALLREDRAIVTPIPGTTRDTLRAELRLKGARIELIDTAGIRASEDVVELEGIRRSLAEIANADLVLALYDLSTPTQGRDHLLELSITAHPQVLHVGSKADLAPIPASHHAKPHLPAPIEVHTSAATGEGLAALVSEMEARLPAPPPLPFLANERQSQLLQRCHLSLKTAVAALANDFPMDLLTTCLRDALTAIRELTGEAASADILESIFSRFCIGK